MFKEIFIVIIVILIVIAGNIMFKNYIETSSESLVVKLTSLSKQIKENTENINDTNNINSLFKDIESEWETNKKTWELFIMHNEIDMIDISFTNIKALIEIDNKQDAVLETEKSMFLLQHIAEKDALKLKNLF